MSAQKGAGTLQLLSLPVVEGGGPYLELDPKLEFLNMVAESTFRPLQDVKANDVQAVWNSVIGRDLKRITAKNIKQAMKDMMGIDAKPRPSKDDKISMDAELQFTVGRYIKKIADSVSPHAKTKTEWNQFAKLIYLQLLEKCPLTDEAEPEMVKRRPDMEASIIYLEIAVELLALKKLIDRIRLSKSHSMCMGDHEGLNTDKDAATCDTRQYATFLI